MNLWEGLFANTWHIAPPRYGTLMTSSGDAIPFNESRHLHPHIRHPIMLLQCFVYLCYLIIIWSDKCMIQFKASLDVLLFWMTSTLHRWRTVTWINIQHRLAAYSNSHQVACRTKPFEESLLRPPAIGIAKRKQVRIFLYIKGFVN